jgi:hypothetical protein
MGTDGGVEKDAYGVNRSSEKVEVRFLELRILMLSQNVQINIDTTIKNNIEGEQQRRTVGCDKSQCIVRGPLFAGYYY